MVNRQRTRKAKRGGAKVLGIHVPFTENTNLTAEEINIQRKQAALQKKRNQEAQNLGYESNENRKGMNKVAQLLGFPNNLTYRNTNAKRMGYKNYANRKVVNRYAQLDGFANDLERKRFMADQYFTVQKLAFQLLNSLFLKEQANLAAEIFSQLNEFLDTRVPIWKHYQTIEAAEQKHKLRHSKPSNQNIGYNEYPETSLSREQLHELEIEYLKNNTPFYAPGDKGFWTRFKAFLLVHMDSLIYKTAFKMFTTKTSRPNIDSLIADIQEAVDNSKIKAEQVY